MENSIDSELPLVPMISGDKVFIYGDGKEVYGKTLQEAQYNSLLETFYGWFPNLSSRVETGKNYFEKDPKTGEYLEALIKNFNFREMSEDDYKLFLKLDKAYYSTKEIDILSYASGKGLSETVKKLVEQGADIHIENDKPMKMAIQNGHLDIVKYLLEQGGKIDPITLVFIAQRGHLDVVKYLVERGLFDINELLGYASDIGVLELVKYLAEHGADIHFNEEYPLLIAGYNEHMDVVKYLMEQGGNIHGHDNYLFKVVEVNDKPKLSKYLKSLK